jgi:hypothetical protein
MSLTLARLCAKLKAENKLFKIQIICDEHIMFKIQIICVKRIIFKIQIICAKMNNLLAESR